MISFWFYSFIFSAFLLTQTPVSGLSLDDSMRQGASLLGKEKNFVYVDLGISDRELEIIDHLKFDNVPPETTVQYDRYGNLHLIREELPVFLRNLGNVDEEVIATITNVIARIAQSVVDASNRNSAWVAVRFSTPMTEFDIPRWHMDGRYYGFDNPFMYQEILFKFAATLKGASTLLYNIPDTQRQEFLDHWNDRVGLSKLVDPLKVESPKKGEGVLFIVADINGAVHSEPKIHENRLFFSVLPGDESEIKELYTRWHPQLSKMASSKDK